MRISQKPCERPGGRRRGMTMPPFAFPGRRGCRRRPDLERLEELVLLSSIPGSSGPPPVVTLGGSGSSSGSGTMLVKDILPGSAGSFPTSLLNAGGTLYFLAPDQNKLNNSLWRSDGTAGGTVDLTPGLEASTPVAAGGSVVFTAFNLSTMSFGIWTTDGTTTGTHQLAALPRSSTAVAAAVGGVAYFDVFDFSKNQDELWKSDGTAAGTGFVANIPTADAMSVAGSELFMVAEDPAAGTELWESDGSAQGTHLVADINPGPSGSFPTNLTPVGGALFFTASSTFNQPPQLWVTDGTAAGTHAVASGLQPMNLAGLGGTLYFTAVDTTGGNPGLWATDGTAGGTRLVAALPAGFPFEMGVTGGLVFFGLQSMSSPGFQLWKSDGTTAGTALVASVPDASELTGSGSRLYFTTDDLNLGNELYSTDGTAGGTGIVADVAPGPNGSYPANLTDVNGTLYFTADDGVHGNELWKTSPPARPVPTTINEGTSFSDTGSFSDAPTDGPWTATVDYGDGTGAQPLALGADGSFVLNHTYADNGSYTATVNVTGANGATGSASVGVSVLNVAPTASIGSVPATSPEGAPIVLTSTVTDPSSVDTAHGFLESWAVTKNGSPYATGSGSSFTFIPDDNGTFVVTLTATDKDGGTSAPVSQSITVVNVAPTVSLASTPATSPEGSPVSFSAPAVDPSHVDTAAGLVESWTVTRNGAPFASGTGGQVAFTPDDNGIYVVSVSAADKDGGAGTASATIVVLNVAPSVTLGGDTQGVRGQPRAFALAATDPSSVDAAAGFVYTINWGDGTPVQSVPEAALPALTHVFQHVGSYSVQATATDKDGGVSVPVSLGVTIASALLEPDPSNPALTALVVGGTVGSDVLSFRPGQQTGSVQVRLNGAVLGEFAPTGHIIAYGQSGNDAIAVSGGVTLPAILHAGKDSSALIGGGGDSVLVGGAGNDVLIASSGRSVLIGGAGSDVIFANANDLIVSGSTVYDGNDAALAAVLGEWEQAPPLAQRIGDLTGGIAGGIHLDDTTVFGDGVANAIVLDGPGDWLLVDPALDDLYGSLAGSVVTDPPAPGVTPAVGTTQAVAFSEGDRGRGHYRQGD